jgi:hypothetical protein
MQVERDGERVRIVLEASEARMLRRALERASFIDTPMSEQAEILDLIVPIDRLFTQSPTDSSHSLYPSRAGTSRIAITISPTYGEATGFPSAFLKFRPLHLPCSS